MASARRSRPRRETLFADAHLKAGSTLPLDADHVERAIYVLGRRDRHRRRHVRQRPPVGVQAGDRITIRALTDAHLTIFGGEPMDGPAPHLVEFRLVAEGAHRASEGGMDRGHFQKVPGDEIEFIPLPPK